MLIQFSVENFMSFKNEVVLSMLAGKGNDNENNLITSDNNDKKHLKTAAIYGANASGKSNLLKAFSAAIMAIRNSSNRQVDQKIFEMVPFKFDDETIKRPTKFEFIFVNEGTKYVYGFSADANKIHNEYLYQYLTSKPSKIFIRKETSEYEFTQDKKFLNEIAERNTENKLFLATAAFWNYEKAKKPFVWFANKINTFARQEGWFNFALDEYAKDEKSGELKKFTTNLMKEADINFDDYNVTIEPMSKENLMGDPILSELVKKGNIRNATGMKITTGHLIEKAKGEKRKYELDLQEESLGTQNLFLLSPIFKKVLADGEIIAIDELDQSLHPFLVQYIIDLFHSPSINKHNAQLIFNTHDTNLLSLDIFRRDQVYFTEKDNKTGVTELYSLDEFSPRKKENIRKGYLQGRYGSIPFLGAGDGLWE